MVYNMKHIRRMWMYFFGFSLKSILYEQYFVGEFDFSRVFFFFFFRNRKVVRKLACFFIIVYTNVRCVHMICGFSFRAIFFICVDIFEHTPEQNIELVFLFLYVTYGCFTYTKNVRVQLRIFCKLLLKWFFAQCYVR